MEFALPEFPATPGAQAAFVAAALLVAVGLIFLVFPASSGQFLGLQSRDGRQGGIGLMRPAGGFLAGLSIAVLLFDQPVLYTMLGIAVALSAFGRLISLMSDRCATVLNFLLLAAQVVLAGATLVYFSDVVTPDFSFTLPEEPDALLVFYCYAAYAFIGAVLLFAPRIACAISGLLAYADTGITSVRSAGGFLIGAAGSSMLFANPMLELGFGAAAALGCIGQVLALLLNRGNLVFAVLSAVVQAAVAGIVLNHVTGMM